MRKTIAAALQAARIINSHFDRHVSHVPSCIAFDGVKLLCVRMAFVIEPEVVIEPHRIDDQRISFTVGRATLMPGSEILEYICQENNQDLQRLEGPVRGPGLQ